MHHPGEGVATGAISNGSEMSAAPITWVLAIIGIGIVALVIYYIIKLKKIENRKKNR